MYLYIGNLGSDSVAFERKMGGKGHCEVGAICGVLDTRVTEGSLCKGVEYTD